MSFGFFGYFNLEAKLFCGFLKHKKLMRLKVLPKSRFITSRNMETYVLVLSCLHVHTNIDRLLLGLKCFETVLLAAEGVRNITIYSFYHLHYIVTLINQLKPAILPSSIVLTMTSLVAHISSLLHGYQFTQVTILPTHLVMASWREMNDKSMQIEYLL